MSIEYISYLFVPYFALIEGRSVPELGMEAKGCQLWFTNHIDIY